MKHLIWLFLLSVLGYGQNTTNLGVTSHNTTITGANYFQGQWQVSPRVNSNVKHCWIYVGSGGTAGNKVDCLVIGASYNNTNTTVQCAGTYTFPSGTINAWVDALPSGCVLSPQETFYVGYDSNDSAMTFGGNSCSCSSTNPTDFSFQGYAYLNLAYANGSYPTLTITTFDNPNDSTSGRATTVQMSIYLVTQPVVNGVVSKETGGFFN